VKVDKLSISFDPDLGDAVRGAARQRGSSVSAWLADAAAAKLRAQALGEYLENWEDAHGPLTTEELDRAAAQLGISSPPARSAA
jgi:hypothetical protein